MTDEQRLRLSNRVTLCEREIAGINHLLGQCGEKLKFWKNEKAAAQAELIGMQLALNLRCSTCGD
ncbi:MAG: hypothetical protein [Arizlama microvirus]|nr:MAG: hypothetical protein [Arizlama microvirus]